LKTAHVPFSNYKNPLYTSLGQPQKDFLDSPPGGLGLYGHLVLSVEITLDCAITFPLLSNAVTWK
jgi:hypothetical protein